jgi:predicted TIM-barrel fold metal-dependent hydrolase
MMAAATRDAPLVDTHAHIYHHGMPLSGSAWHHPRGDATMEDYLSTLDAAGVRFAVLAAASIYGDYNDYSLDAVRRHKRLRTTVIVHPDTPMPILRKMSDDGVVGIRFQFRNVASPPDLTSFAYRSLLARVADLGWHVHLHDDGARLANFIAPIEAAGPRLVIDHFGRPSPPLGVDAPGFQAVLRAVDRGRTWVKISGGFRLEPPAAAATFAARLVASAGPDRLLWGSDWPFAAFEDKVTYAGVLEDYRHYVPDASTRQAIDRTALSFYFS